MPEVDIYGDGFHKQLDIFPNECPLCNMKIAPLFVAGRDIPSFPPLIQIIFQCPNEDCGKLFISNYSDRKNRPWHFDSSYPKNPIPQVFSEIIKSISPCFVAIYKEAFHAESLELGKICGPGYRKALEYLIKDYCIKCNPGKEDHIKDSLLATCIKEYIKNEKLLACIERAAWLGNDESHYLKKWEDKDVLDLKLLIKMSINWIELLENTAFYEDNMEKKR